MFCRLGLDELSRPVAADGLVERGVDAPVPRVDQLRQRLEVGGVELVELAPLQQRVDDRVRVAELLQHAGVGRELALGGLLAGLQAELVVQDLRAAGAAS